MARLILATAMLLATATPIRAQDSGEDPATEDSVEQPALDWRVACIEAKESGGANVWNLHGSGAGGVMQYMESTFRAHAAEMGHYDWSRWVPWQARLVASYDLSMGRRRQWTISGCGE